MLITAILAYLVVQLGIGYWAGRFIKGEADYFLAGRSLGIGLASVSLFATWFGAETVMGSSAAIAKEGLAGSRTDPFGYSLCLLLMAVFLAYKMRAANYLTLGDFFRERFGGKAEKLAVLVFAPTSLLWAAAQLLAFSEIVSTVTGISHQQALLGGTAFILLYTIIGGMKADVIHDLLQGCVVIIGLTTLAAVMVSQAGGVAQAWQSITPEQLRFTTEGEGWLPRLDSWAVPVLGSLVAQEVLSRLFATKSAKVARQSCFIAAGIYFVVGLLPAISGLMGPHVAADISQSAGDNYIVVVAQEMLSPIMYVLFVGALIAAILSTVDSTLLSLSALVEHNLLSPFFPQATGRQRVKMARMCVAASGIAAYLFASSSDGIYALLEQASSFGSAGILVTVLIGLHFTHGRSVAAIGTLLTGVITSVAGNYVECDAPYLSSIAISLIVYVALSVWEGRGALAKQKVSV